MVKALMTFLMTMMVVSVVFIGDCLAGADYLPLNEGRKWEYDDYLQTIDGREKVEGLLEGTALSVSELDGLDVVPIKMFLRAKTFPDPGRTYLYFYVKSEEGLRVVAIRGPKDSQPKRMVAWRYKYPLQVGKSWTADEQIGGLKDSPTVQMIHVIESMDETVTVKAGTFDKCMKITGHFSGKVNLGSYGGSPDILLESERWYAPGIGMVKHHEKQTSSDPKMGTVERYSELKSYKE